jgi:hypothetical protein
MTAEHPINEAQSSTAAALERAKVYEEGFVAGLIGAATIAVWFLILDAIQGRPLYTPTILGTALFRGGESLALPGSVTSSFEIVLWFTWVHGLVFIVIGGAASWLVCLAARDPNYGFGILLFFVVLEFGFIGVSLLFAQEVLQALAWPAILVGNLLAAAAMAWYFWHRHRQLTIWP